MTMYFVSYTDPDGYDTHAYTRPEEVIISSSVEMFDARSDKFWKDQPMKYDYKDELRL